jgi:hypothetical protein
VYRSDAMCDIIEDVLSGRGRKKGLIRFTMFEDTLALRTVKTGAVSAVFLTLLLIGTGHPSWAVGFFIGAALSLFSIFSLMVVVPFLMRPGAPSYASTLLGLALFMKLPTYVLGLYFAVRIAGSSPINAILCITLGVLLAPLVITLKTLGTLLAETRYVRTLPAIERPRPSRPTARTVRAKLADERG